MGLWDAVKTAVNNSIERERERVASRRELEKAIREHNETHNDTLRLTEHAIQACSTGLFGWDDRFDVPSTAINRAFFCARCAKWHVKEGS